MGKKEKKQRPVVLACGGTGGHIYPAVAVGLEIERRFPGTEVWVMGRRKGMEKEIAERYGFRFAPVGAQKLPGGNPVRLLVFGILTLAALLEAAVKLLRIRPFVVVGFGGYVSFPGVLSAAILGNPVYLQEQNVIPGKVNQRLSRWARGMFVSFDATASMIGCEAIKTGNPTRFEGKRLSDKAACCEKLNLAPARKTILVFGGSQGAASINRAAVDFAKTVKNNTELQILHLTGKGNYDEVSKSYKNVLETGERGLGLLVSVLPYLEEMELAYTVADIVVCRAGATAIAELVQFGKPAVLVPYPHAAESHQAENAEFLAGKNAAIVISDASFSGSRMAEEVEKLLSDSRRLGEMSEAARSLAENGAASRIVDRLVALCA